MNVNKTSTPSHWQPTGQSPPGPAPPAGIQGLPSLLLPPSAHLSPLLIKRLLPAHPSHMSRDRSRPHFTGGETEADGSQLKGSGRQWPGQDLDPAPTASPWASPETGLPAFPTQSRDLHPSTYRGQAPRLQSPADRPHNRPCQSDGGGYQEPGEQGVG